MENQVINLGGTTFQIKATGADEALEKVNELVDKLKEAKALIEDLASMDVNIGFGEDDGKLL